MSVSTIQQYKTTDPFRFSAIVDDIFEDAEKVFEFLGNEQLIAEHLRQYTGNSWNRSRDQKSFERFNSWVTYPIPRWLEMFQHLSQTRQRRFSWNHSPHYPNFQSSFRRHTWAPRPWWVCWRSWINAAREPISLDFALKKWRLLFRVDGALRLKRS